MVEVLGGIRMEIAYHPEPNLNNGNRTENILHVHEYLQQDNFRVRPAHLITKQEMEWVDD